VASQWIIGLIAFGMFNLGSSSRDEANRRAAGISAWTAAKAWVLSLDPAVGYAWMAAVAVLLLAMAAGAPRPPQLARNRAVRYDEIDSLLQFGVIAIGTSAVVVGLAMCVGAEVESGTVTVRSTIGEVTKDVTLPHVGKTYMLQILAVMSMIIVTLVAAAMTQSIETTKDSLRKAYAFVDDRNLDHIDALIRDWSSDRINAIRCEPSQRLLWPGAVFAAFGATALGTLLVLVASHPAPGKHAIWPLVVPFIFSATLVCVRLAAAILGNSRTRPRNLVITGQLAFVYLMFATSPAFITRRQGPSLHAIIAASGLSTVPAVVALLAVWLPTWKRSPWSAPIAAYGLIAATSGTTRNTSAKVGYVDELRRTAWMDRGVASKSRRQFEALRTAQDLGPGAAPNNDSSPWP